MVVRSAPSLTRLCGRRSGCDRRRSGRKRACPASSALPVNRQYRIAPRGGRDGDVGIAGRARKYRPLEPGIAGHLHRGRPALASAGQAQAHAFQLVAEHAQAGRRWQQQRRPGQRRRLPAARLPGQGLLQRPQAGLGGGGLLAQLPFPFQLLQRLGLRGRRAFAHRDRGLSRLQAHGLARLDRQRLPIRAAAHLHRAFQDGHHRDHR